MSEEKKEQVDTKDGVLTCEDVKKMSSKDAKEYLCKYITENEYLQQNYDKFNTLLNFFELGVDTR